MNPDKTILLIEDEPAMALGSPTRSAFEGYRVVHAETGARASSWRAPPSRPTWSPRPDAPDTNGFEVCAQLRQWSRTVPILMLSARSQDSDKIRGLDAGADDYVTKPFSLGELVARVRAALRRASGATQAPAWSPSAGREVNLAGHVAVVLDGKEEALTSHEVELLRLLLERAGEAIVARRDPRPRCGACRPSTAARWTTSS
jgi:DNA-binding response OmpR family regulator